MKNRKKNDEIECPPVPAGLIPYLEHYRGKAERGRDSVPCDPGSEAAVFAFAQRAYWANVVKGINWLIGAARLSIGTKAEKRRRAAASRK